MAVTIVGNRVATVMVITEAGEDEKLGNGGEIMAAGARSVA
jgi:hypothetical protein